MHSCSKGMPHLGVNMATAVLWQISTFPAIYDKANICFHLHCTDANTKIISYSLAFFNLLTISLNLWIVFGCIYSKFM